MSEDRTGKTRLLGLDLGGTNIKAAVIEITGGDVERAEIIHTDQGPTEAKGGPERVGERLVEVARAATATSGPVDSLGLGVPGLFDFSSGDIVFFTNLPGPWEGFPLRRRIAESLGIRVTLINDARAFTLAEGKLGAGRGCRTVACLTLGTGVGGGLIVDGRLHFGAFGLGGEIGHQTVDPAGPVCGCGNPGCMEALTRAPVVAANAGRQSFEAVIEGYQAGDDACVAAMDAALYHMAIGLGNILTVIGPERIVIGGGVAEAGDVLLGPLRAAVKERVTLIPPDRVHIVPAELGLLAGAIGAAMASRGSPVGDADFLVGEIPSAELRRSEMDVADEPG